MVDLLPIYFLEILSWLPGILKPKYITTKDYLFYMTHVRKFFYHIKMYLVIKAYLKASGNKTEQQGKKPPTACTSHYPGFSLCTYSQLTYLWTTFPLPRKHVPKLPNLAIWSTRAAMCTYNPIAKLWSQSEGLLAMVQIHDFPLLCLQHTASLCRRPKLLNPETQVFHSAVSFTVRKSLEKHRSAVNMATTPLHPPLWSLDSLFILLFILERIAFIFTFALSYKIHV